jgi:uracil-DNA glycosylase family 4
MQLILDLLKIGKPTSQEIKRYSRYVKEHISIIDPKIVILMGSTAMEAVTSITNKNFIRKRKLERNNY